MNSSEILPAPEFYTSLSFVANSEKKAVIQLLVEPGEEISARELNGRFASIQEPAGAVRYGSLNNLPQTVNNSHVPAGSFTSSEELRYSTWFAKKSQDSRIVDAIAGHALGISADFDSSLERLFNKSSAPEGAIRSPEVRSRILGRLATADEGSEFTLVNLGKDLSISPQTLHSNAGGLYRNGFVDYAATQVTDQDVRYEITGDTDPMHSTQTARGPRERRRWHYAGMLSARAELGYLLKECAAEGTTSFSFDDMLERIDPNRTVNTDTLRGALELMMREGVVERTHKIADGKTKFSSISLNDQQREIAERLSTVVEGLQAHDEKTIDEGIERGKDIIANPELVTTLLMRGYRHTFSVNSVALEQRAAEIGALVGEEPKTTGELAAAYADSNLSREGVYTVLSRMRSSGILTTQKHGNQVYWFRAEKK